MRKTYYVCDRCGISYEHISKIHALRITYQETKSPMSEEEIVSKDLCGKCLQELNVWFTEGKG